MNPAAPRPLTYRLHGQDVQALEVRLEPGQGMIAEAGAMLYIDDGIQMESGLGSGPNEGLAKSLLNAGKRLLGGEKIFVTHYRNDSAEPRFAAFAAPHPGGILTLELSKLGGRVVAQRGAFLCGSGATRIALALQKKLMAGLFGGEGFLLQSIEGDGQVFLQAGGSMLMRDLAAGQVLWVDTGCFVAMQGSVSYDIEIVKGLKSMLFAGEGVFLLKLTGPGKVWLQSAPFDRTLAAVRQEVQGLVKGLRK